MDTSSTGENATKAADAVSEQAASTARAARNSAAKKS